MNEDKKMVLEMLKEGKVTTEEAEKLLDAIDNANQRSEQEKAQASGKNAKGREFDPEKIRKEMGDAWGKVSSKMNAKSLGNLGEEIANFGSELGNTLMDMLSGVTGFNFSSGNTEKMNSDLTMDLSGVDSPIVDFKAVNGSIEVVAPESEMDDDQMAKVSVEVQYKSNNVEPGDSLFDFYLNENILTFMPKYTNIKLNLKCVLPRKQYGEIRLLTKNGLISVSSLNAYRLTLESSNGSLHVIGCKGENADMTTKNARIEIQNSDFDFITGNTSNGKILLSRCSGDSMEMKTSNSKIVVEKVESPDMWLKTSNSAIIVDGVAVGRLNASTSNSKIEISNYDEKMLSLMELATTNAPIRILQVPAVKPYFYDLETSMGNIHINKERLLYLTNNQANYGMKSVEAESPDFETTPEEGRIRVTASTSNGSIQVG